MKLSVISALLWALCAFTAKAAEVKQWRTHGGITLATSEFPMERGGIVEGCIDEMAAALAAAYRSGAYIRTLTDLSRHHPKVTAVVGSPSIAFSDLHHVDNFAVSLAPGVKQTILVHDEATGSFAILEPADGQHPIDFQICSTL